jgi:APA family basic amino acid/polyamine antiporter
MTTRRRDGSALRRELGLIDAVGIGVGAIVGAGIFVVLGIAAGVAGPALLLGLALAGVAATGNALSSAQLAATYPVSGGTYAYGRRTIGPRAGFAAGWMFLVGKIASLGTVAIGIGLYLETLVPGLSSRAVAMSAVVVFTALNYWGVRRSSMANLAVVTVSVVSLLCLVAFSLPMIQPANLGPFAPEGWRATLEAAGLMFFAYTGYARIATLGEEVRDPGRTIPRAIVITLVATFLLYGLVGFAAVGSVGAGALAAASAPLEHVARATGGMALATVVSVGGLTAMLGVILSQLLGLSRMVFAMAREGDLPAVLGQVEPSRGVPHRAVLFVGAVGLVVTASGTLTFVAATSSFSLLLYYGIANLSALRMPRAGKLVSDVIPAVGLLVCVVLAAFLPAATGLTGVGLLSVGFLVRAFVHRTKPN